jgi:hypothetical protein
MNWRDGFPMIACRDIIPKILKEWKLNPQWIK